MSAPADHRLVGSGSGHTPLDLPLGRGGTTFIEASAGTGKTHALTTLVARLVIEEGWSLDRILVVTFTRAATTELRDRIRRVLGALLDAVRVRDAARDGGERAEAGGRGPEADGRAPDPVVPPVGPTAPGGPEARAPEEGPVCAAYAAAGDSSSHLGGTDEPEIDPQARELLDAWERQGRETGAALARRLESAMRDIDRANILTIHGFCQRVLADLAFESGFPFGFEVSGGGHEAVAAGVRDFWRRRLYPASTLVVSYAIDSGLLPDQLAGWVSELRARTGVTILGGEPPPEPIEAHEAAWRRVFDEARAEWETGRARFEEGILDGPWLNRQRYQRKRTERDLAALEALLTAPDPRLPKEEGRFGRYGREALSRACKSRFTLPDLPLLDAFDRLEAASEELRSACARWLQSLRRQALDEVRASVRRRVRDDRRLAYDDLLIELDAALVGEDGGRLSRRIRRELPCALIDEYQDTDPVQARIFGRIYDDPGDGPDAEPAAEPPPTGPCIVVGDPKQSIYSFRGADVFSYLAARRTARWRLHLERNWRSVPALVEAVNAVFAGAAPFMIPEIEYRPVDAAMEDGGSPLRIDSGEDDKPFRLWLLPRRADDRKLVTKTDASPIAVAATANEIARLVGLGACGEATIDGTPLTGGDIAVLVRTRERGRLVADALRERGVPSVEIADQSVFGTREAEQVERLLWVLAEPGRESAIGGALAGDLFGLDARALHALGDEEQGWSGWMEQLADWRTRWGARGIGSLLLWLLEARGGATHLLGDRDGVRRLTNVRHLAELLQEAETRERLAPTELATWLNRRRTRTGPEHSDDPAQLRLESDEQLVRILTVHGAKGLEFPVVFCPFAWDVPSRRSRSGDTETRYHLGATDDYREVLDLEPSDQSMSIARLEEHAESVRLLYVALTRAKYRCVVVWGQVNGAAHSPLAWLLHGAEVRSAAMTEPDGGAARGNDAVRSDGGPAAATFSLDTEAPDPTVGAAQSASGPSGLDGETGAAPEDEAVEDGVKAVVTALEAVSRRFAELSAPDWLDEIEEFARRLPDVVSVTVLGPEPPPFRPLAFSPVAPPSLAARALDRTLRRTRSLTSFTALSAEAAEAAETARTAAVGAGDRGRPPVGSADADVDRPDHDQREAPDDAAEEVVDAPGGGARRERNAFTFPRGPVVGRCLHWIFERLDAPPEIGRETPDLDELCRMALEDFGIGNEWRSTARDIVERARAVSLGESRDVRGGGFCLRDPLPRLTELEFHFPVEGLDRDRLDARLAEYGYPNPFARPRSGAPSESRSLIDGYLRGFIDLIVEHAGRWYVVDYKSNWLGSSPDDYVPEALTAAMEAGGYPLQFLIYLVALHRYLSLRLPDYEYERHVGGAFYLFVRGIDPAAGMRRGVYFDRPSAACLQALDDCFRFGEKGDDRGLR